MQKTHRARGRLDDGCNPTLSLRQLDMELDLQRDETRRNEMRWMKAEEGHGSDEQGVGTDEHRPNEQGDETNGETNEKQEWRKKGQTSPEN